MFIINEINNEQGVENFSKSFKLKLVGNCGEMCTFTVAYYNKVA